MKYIFESILRIFGKDVKNNLVSILTCNNGKSVNILDSFEGVNMRFRTNKQNNLIEFGRFVGNFYVNS